MKFFLKISFAEYFFTNQRIKTIYLEQISMYGIIEYILADIPEREGLNEYVDTFANIENVYVHIYG